jgi:hypothetical protein
MLPGTVVNTLENLLHFEPHLPKWLPDATPRVVMVGKDKVDLRFWQENDATK